MKSRRQKIRHSYSFFKNLRIAGKKVTQKKIAEILNCNERRAKRLCRELVFPKLFEQKLLLKHFGLNRYFTDSSAKTGDLS